MLPESPSVAVGEDDVSVGLHSVLLDFTSYFNQQTSRGRQKRDTDVFDSGESRDVVITFEDEGESAEPEPEPTEEAAGTSA